MLVHLTVGFVLCRCVTVEFGHLIEIYDFPPQLQTCDLLAAFIDFKYVSLDL